MHRSLYVSMPHCPHDGSQAAGPGKDSSAVVMAGTIKDQFFRKASLLPRLTEQTIYRTQVTRSRALRRKHPALGPCSAACTQKIADAPAHWNKSPTLRSLAVRHKDHAIFPIEILDAHAVGFPLISHSRIAHRDHNVAEQFKGSNPPPARLGGVGGSVVDVVERPGRS